MYVLTFPPPVLTGSGSTGPLSHLSHGGPPRYSLARTGAGPWQAL